MSDNKLFEKTELLLQKQDELAKVINELKVEVKSVYFTNINLTKENALLKEQINTIDKGIEKDGIVPQNKTSEKQHDNSKLVSTVNDNESNIITKSKRLNIRNTAFAEFFLGKNVIAKIAILLLFLGVVSFGQMAYVDLNDIGRVIMILFSGVAFWFIAVLFEKRESIVFSNAFYAISISIIFYTNILAGFTYGLYGNSIFSYISICIMIGTYFYFYNRRYEFLDIVLFVFYVVVALSTATYMYNNTGFSSYIELSLFTVILGYIIYQYLKKYYYLNPKIKSILISCFSFAIITYMITILVLNYDAESLKLYTYILYGLFSLLFVYFINIIYKHDERSKLVLVIPICSFFVLMVTSVLFMSIFDLVFNLNSVANIILIFVISFIPLYGLLVRRGTYGSDRITRIYISIIAFSVLIYSFVASNLQVNRILGFEYLNLILATEVLVFFILSIIRKDKLYKILTVILLSFLVVRDIVYHLTDNTYLFKDSFVTITGVILGIGSVIVYELFKKYKNNEDQLVNVVIHSLTLFMFIPFVITITKNMLSSEGEYILTMIIVLFIGYRWLCEMKFFNILYKKHLILGINSVLICLTLFLNFNYFDHNFSHFEDVFKFLILLSINIYITYSLRDIFIGYFKNKDEQRNFIIIYIFGVIIHSIFICNYINFEFDKVVLSSYFLIASAIGILIGFRYSWNTVRIMGLAAIYISLSKFFIYDFYNKDTSNFEYAITFIVLGSILLTISFLYGYLEKTYGKNNAKEIDDVKEIDDEV